MPMNIIKKLLCWYKARFTDLTDKEFSSLRNSYRLASTPLVQQILQTYFRYHQLSDSKINLICEGSWMFRQLYMLNIRRGRPLTAYEQNCMVHFMPLGGPYRFPSPLDLPALDTLFADRRPYKIAAYVRDFSVPPQFELQLLDLCQAEQRRKFPLNTYRGALLSYLHLCKEPRFRTTASQKALLALKDAKLTEALIECGTYPDCILTDEVIELLIADKDFETLDLILFHSSIDSAELIPKMLRACPALKWQAEISKLRKPMYRLEQDTCQFLGITAPTMAEFKLILESLDADNRNDRYNTFVQNKIVPLLKNTASSPYFCAWAAHNFPEVAEKAYLSVRATAECLRKRYALN